MQCHLWIPMPELIVQLLNRFNLSISQVNLCGLQHLVGILVLSYELGITLGADHLEVLVEPRWSTSLIVQVRPLTNMAIILEFISKYHFWKVIDHGFYPLLAMVYKCFNIYLQLYRVYLEYLQVQGRFGGMW
ncbi:hypothetical protein YC2023_018503 [Brassica napus]